MTHLGLRAADQVAGLPELSWHLSEALVRARLTLDATKERRSAPSISNIRNQAFAYARDLLRTATFAIRPSLRSGPSADSNIRNQAFAYARDLLRTAMRVTRSPCLAYRQQHFVQADR